MHLAKNIANIALALLILASTTGVTLHKHYCMGHVKNIALMHEAVSCQNEVEMNMPDDCCKDTIEEFQVEELNKTAFNFDISPDLYLISALSYYLIDLDLESSLSTQTAFLNYKPPLIERDIPVTIQSFLL